MLSSYFFSETIAEGGRNVEKATPTTLSSQKTMRNIRVSEEEPIDVFTLSDFSDFP